MEKVVHIANNPWLKSGTIRENILFGSPMSQSHYDKVIKACGLLEDFSRLALGDRTW
jgi:ABC-type transport system involved in cytochrome bd biosynthesis fused ATPase/permease subunit